MTIQTRRGFLGTAAFAATALAIRPAKAFTLTTSRIGPLDSAETLMLSPADPGVLESLAAEAMTAARSAGATYADIRIAEYHRLDVSIVVADSAALQATLSYGIRVCVDGAWAFVYGSVPTPDAVAIAARNAVSTARGYASLARQQTNMAGTVTATGRWETPIEIDPFTVPLRDQFDLLHAFEAAGTRVLRVVNQGSVRWEREVRTFASTDGALLTQTFHRGYPYQSPSANSGIQPPPRVRLPWYRAQAAGYEMLLMPAWQEQFKDAAERALEWSQMPIGQLDVGKYPVVLDGISLGIVLGQTLGVALEMDRVAGIERDAAGGSILAPPADMLGKPVVSSHLSVAAGREVPSPSAARWDDDGVPTRSYDVIRDGKIVDYHTSRQTASLLDSWYASQGRAPGSNGCAVAISADQPVMIRVPSLTVAPASESKSIEELCKEVKRGILIRQCGGVSTDQQVASGLLTWGEMFEIVNGTVKRRIKSTGLQFGTLGFWNSLVTLGGQDTMAASEFSISKGMPWRQAYGYASAPAGLFKDVNVIAVGRRRG